MKAMMRNLFESLKSRGAIETTRAKAIQLKSFISRMPESKEIMQEWEGLKMFKLGTRKGDNAPMVKLITTKYFTAQNNAKAN